MHNNYFRRPLTMQKAIIAAILFITTASGLLASVSLSQHTSQAATDWLLLSYAHPSLTGLFAFSFLLLLGIRMARLQRALVHATSKYARLCRVIDAAPAANFRRKVPTRDIVIGGCPLNAQAQSSPTQVDFSILIEQEPRIGVGMEYTPPGDESIAKAIDVADNQTCCAPENTYKSGTGDEMHLDETTAQLETIQCGIRRKSFTAHFQPIMEISSGYIHHYEALARLPTHDGRVTMPIEFIPLAERRGIVHCIDQQILKLVLEYLRLLDEHGIDLSISVNMSAIHFEHAQTRRNLLAILHEAKGIAGKLILEITETTVIRDMGTARRFMYLARDMGCRFALDDFGAGVISFAHLRALPLDFVKIDGSFVRSMASNIADRRIVQAITYVAKAFHQQVIGEFAEDQEIVDLLASDGVDYAQGNWIGRPEALSPEDLLKRHSGSNSVSCVSSSLT